VDLIPADSAYPWNTPGVHIPNLPGIKPSEAQNQEAIAIDALTLEQYHQICYWNLSQSRNFYCSASATVNLNTIYVCPSGDRLEDSVEIALLPDGEGYLGHWGTERVIEEVMEGGWTRYCNVISAA
jgi:enterochelin esterase-like enzyme